MSKKKPFNELDSKTKLMVITSLTFLVLLGLFFLLGVFFLGMVGLFQLLGVDYESNRSLVWFGMMVFAIGFIFEALAKLIKAVKVKRAGLQFIIGIDLLFTWVSVYIVDELIAGVTMHFWSQWIFALLLVAVDYAFDDRKIRKEKLA
ncbi:YrvL family regulatory protein [Halobacillus sp. A5]|uniref:YrvL family regulatory protein n=1 Tax=Halobacillus sp. A5 TaxID=2880263 RepID=UPI0020A6BA0B|nr:YrvL family regulatory protein [Halobacillus sp. A5]MCP3027403.1 regulatory YrvL family protein [Halobacillus sp. A5]